MSNFYNLYLDESETHNTDSSGKWINQVFCISGIIVKEDFHNSFVIPEINKIKKEIWSDLPDYLDKILHEKEIRYVQNPNNKYKLNKVKSEYIRFGNPNNSMKLFTGLEKIIRQKEITIIGSCIVIDELNRNFHPEILSNKSLIAMQIIMENFCHFLKLNNGVGRIFYESIEDEPDKQMCLRFHHIKATGTMYVNPHAIQKMIISIDFPKKGDNIAGLQVADFIPNDIAREIAKKKKHQFNLCNVIRRREYDGNMVRKDKYGVKIIPRIL